MDIKPQPKLSFHGVDFPIVNFQLEDFKNSVEISLESEITPKAVLSKKEPLQFKIIFELNLKSVGTFNLIVVAVGHFSFGADLNEQMKSALLNTNAPAILFPYLRSFVSTFTSNVGHIIQPILLPPHFFQGSIVVETIE